MRRVLLDENLPRLLKRELPGFEVQTVAEVGWAGIKNGKLLRLAETEFDVFVTADKNLPHQQPLTTLDLAIVVLRARTTKLEDLLPLVAAKSAQEGQTARSGRDPARKNAVERARDEIERAEFHFDALEVRSRPLNSNSMESESKRAR